MIWNELRLEDIECIEKCVAEFQIWSNRVLPYGKMKVKIYENQDGNYSGYTDIRIIRKFDNSPDGAVGHGDSIESALSDTVNYFMQMVKEDYPTDQFPDGLPEDCIEYSDFSDF